VRMLFFSSQTFLSVCKMHAIFQQNCSSDAILDDNLKNIFGVNDLCDVNGRVASRLILVGIQNIFIITLHCIICISTEIMKNK
jgi:hypothetical protein